MIDIKNKKDCSGCHACMSVCPNNCITMQKDDEGFLYPYVDMENCTECGLCIKACHVLNKKEIVAQPKAYAAYNKDEDVRMNSSSGGVFTNLATYAFEKGGVVFGAMFDENYDVYHGYIDSSKDLQKMRCSKYLQSIIGDAYIKTKEFLDNGTFVLFTGTPCQTAGLKLYLNKEYDNLLIMDIICHGVPSPKVWQKYRDLVGKNADNINFRDKTKGWRNFSLRFDFGNKKKIRIQDDDKYLYAFFRNIILRPSCYDCVEKDIKRNADITIADFWGIETAHPEFSDDKGISLIITQNKKGEDVLGSVKDGMEIIDSDIDMVSKYNIAATKSPKIPSVRQEFFDRLDDGDFEKLLNEYCKDPFKVRMQKKKEANIIKIKTIIKKIIRYKRKG